MTDQQQPDPQPDPEAESLEKRPRGRPRGKAFRRHKRNFTMTREAVAALEALADQHDRTSTWIVEQLVIAVAADQDLANRILRK